MLKEGMSYSIDLRRKVIGYVEKGGSRVKACRIFGISRKTIYHWFHRENLAPTPAKTRRRKLDKFALAQHVRHHPDALLRERAGGELLESDLEWQARAAACLGWSSGWERRYLECAAQRGLKVIGTFLRLASWGRGEYLGWLPRVQELACEAAVRLGAPGELVEILKGRPRGL